MSVKYVLTERRNLLHPDQPRKFYAQAKGDGFVSLKKLSKEISETSTVNDADVLAVLNDLTKALSKYLSEGKIVRLGDFGTFQITIASDGADSVEHFDSSLIKKSRIRFRPGIDLRVTMETVKYEKMK